MASEAAAGRFAGLDLTCASVAENLALDEALLIEADAGRGTGHAVLGAGGLCRGAGCVVPAR